MQKHLEDTAKEAQETDLRDHETDADEDVQASQVLSAIEAPGKVGQCISTSESARKVDIEKLKGKRPVKADEVSSE